MSKTKKTTEHKAPNFSELLTEALTLEGKIADCFSAFHNYSVQNQFLAYKQLKKAEPINTYKGWAELGRQVNKGSKAIELCMPFTIKNPDELDEDGKPKTFMVFGFRRNWFGLSQTEGDDYVMPEVPGLNIPLIIKNLDIEQIEYAKVNGNVQGYSTGRKFALNPICADPIGTTFHELAHIVLGHTGETFDHDRTARNIREVEAEAVAYILCHAFKFTAYAGEARAYIQGWLKTDKIEEKSAKKIFKAASEILKANKA